ncbi:hypothetical protein BD779DRAFT_1539608, partial [Infundibulicybe gibba]
MGNEAVTAGLDLTPLRAEWDWMKLEEDRPTESLSFVWRILEAIHSGSCPTRTWVAHAGIFLAAAWPR